MCHYCSSPDHSSLAHGDSTENDGPASDGRSRPNQGGFEFPVGVGLEFAFCGYCSGKTIVDEHHSMTDKHSVLNGYPFANERVRRNLAARTHLCAFLDLYESTDL